MSAVPADIGRIPSRWLQPLATLAVLVVAILLLYRETAITMVAIWQRSETFAHAFLVPPISLWLVWRCRHELAQLQPRPAPWALLPMALAGFLWLLGDLVSVNAAAQFALVAMLVLAVPATLGWAVTRTILFPLGFLFFSVPFGEFMLPALMDRTADFTVWALRATNIPVYREGLRFVIPSGTWSVVEACSGVRYLIASLMVGSLFAYLNYRSMRRRWAFVGVSIVVPIIANWLRAYMIVMIGHLSDNRLAVGVDHLIYGWVFFGVVITLMFLVGARWSEPDAPLPAVRGDADAVAASPWPGSVGTAAAAIALFVLPHAAVAVLDGQRATADARVVLAADGWTGGWRPAARGGPDFQPRFEGMSTSARAWLHNGAREAGVWIGYYRAQNAERKLVGSHNVLVTADSKHWNLTDLDIHRIALAGGELAVRRARIVPGHAAPRATQLTAWQLYWVDGTFVQGDAEAKLRGAAGRLAGHGDDGAVVVLYAEGEPAAADAALQAFAAANLDVIRAALEAARVAR